MAIDGNSLLFRAFYALPLLQNAQGMYTNAVYGFLNMMLRLIQEHKPDYLAVAFDLKGPTFRHKVYSEYKAGRKEMPPELAPQFEIAREVLGAMGVCTMGVEGFEADDLLGTLSRLANDAGMEALLVTGDRDALQLIGPMTTVLLTKKGITDIARMDLAAFCEKYGVEPGQMVDVKALMGDPSDHIPGIPGVGEKTALKLISEFGDLESVLGSIDQVKGKKIKELLASYGDQARMCRTLAKIVTDVPVDGGIEQAKFDESELEKGREALMRYGFQSLVKRLGGEEAASGQDDERQARNVERVAIQSEQELDSVLKEIKSAERIALRLGDMTQLARDENKIYEIRAEHTLLMEGLNPTTMLTKLKPLLEDESVSKTVEDKKALMSDLAKEGIILRGADFDAHLAAYLLDATAAHYRLEKLCEKYLGQRREDAAALFALREPMLRRLEQEGMSALFNEVEMPLVQVLFDMEQTGFSVDIEELTALGKDFEQKIEHLTNEIYQMAGGTFNLNSPKQLGEVLFERLGLPGKKKTKTGYSTDIEVLMQLSGEHPIVERVIEYRQYAKLKSTYIDGLLALTDKQTHKVHTKFQQTVTATGRISSTEPNLQNIPIRTGLGAQIRKAFSADGDSDILVAADYSQIELRVLAHIANDEVMIDAFLRGQDIHRRTASEVFDCPLEEVTSQMRSSAKAVNFGIVYGISDFGLARNLHIPRAQAAEFIQKYLQKYAGIERYMKEIVQRGEEMGYVSTLMGRRRYLPELNAKNNYNTRSFGKRVAMNTPIQGTAADIIKMAMNRVHQDLKEKGFRAKLILQVHDELIVNAPREEQADVEALLRDCMENIYEMRVPLVVDIKAGENWFLA